jgi:hypothetical protein
VNKAVVQLLPYPPSNTPDLAPPYLIGQKTLLFGAPTKGGDFTLDLRPYLVPGATSGSASIGDEQLFNQQLAPLFGIGTQASPSPKSVFDPNAGGNLAIGGNVTIGGGTSSVSSSLATVGNGLFPIGFAGHLYVRIIPITGGSPAFPSNPVGFDMVDAPPPLVLNVDNGPGTNEGAYTIDFDVTLPKTADDKYLRCAIVKEITDDYVPNLVINYPAYLASGKPLCYEPPDGGWSLTDAFDAFVEFVADVWDTVADSYTWIKGKVVDAMLIAVPCKQIADDDVCQKIAETALDAALASFGIPPSLPNFDAVVAASKGDLAAFIVDAAGGLPGVAEACGFADAANEVASKVQTCEELAAQAIDQVVAHLEEARSDAAGKASGYAWPGVVLAPDPRGEYQPPSVTYTVKRTADPVLPSTCHMAVSLSSTVHDWHWEELIAGYPKTAYGDVTGSPFLAATAPIPPLAPGETFTRQVWLTDPAKWTESQDAWEYWYYYKGLADSLINRSFVLLQKGAELTFKVSGNCTPVATHSYVLTENGYDL